MSGEDGDRRLLVAEYVLGLLEEPERAAMARAIEADPALAEEERFWQARFAGLDHLYGEVTPPARVRARIEGRLFGAGHKRPWYDSLLLWRGLAGAAVLLAVVGLGIGVLRPASDPLSGPDLVAAMRAEEVELAVVALYAPETQALRVSAHGAPAPHGHDFELWLIGPDGAPVSMGLVFIGEGHTLVLDDAVRAAVAQGVTLAISIEPEGGSPLAGPSGPVVATGVAAAI